MTPLPTKDVVSPLALVRGVRERYFLARARRDISRWGIRSERLEPFSGADPDEPFRTVVVGALEYFIPYREAIALELSSLGAVVTSVASLEEIPSAPGEAPHAVLVIGGHLHPIRSHRRRLASSVLAAVQTEQVPSRFQGALEFNTKHLASFINWSRHYDLVFEWSRSAVPVLERHHSAVIHVPHGRLVLGDDRPSDPDEEQYDLLFLGSVGAHDKRRREILRSLSRTFSTYPMDRGVWGPTKVDALRSSRIVLNLHVEPSLRLESPRFFEALSMRRFLVSEGVADPHPFTSGKDFVEVSLLDLGETIGAYLSDPSARLAIAEHGHRTTLEHDMRRSAGVMLQHVLNHHWMIGSRSRRGR
jgi:hypothetical protein